MIRLGMSGLAALSQLPMMVNGVGGPLQIRREEVWDWDILGPELNYKAPVGKGLNLPNKRSVSMKVVTKRRVKNKMAARSRARNRI